jgi:signal peptide peptidase SppA
MHNKKCFLNHIGPWLIKPDWFMNAVGVIKAGKWPIKAMEDEGPSPYQLARRAMLMGALSPEDARKWGFYSLAGNVAVIDMVGPMMKGDSKYGGVNTVLTRQIVRTAVSDDLASSILLVIDSPGGSVAGTAELATEVKNANEKKPVHAHIDDLGASAAFWVASQARRVSANATAQVGSIGTVAVVEDTSKMYEAAGVKVHVISTGEFKGAFADGTPVTEAQIQYLQDLVNEINKHFLNAVADGRKMSLTDVKKAADGRVFMAKESKELGLIDVIQSLDDTAMQMSEKYQLPKRKMRASTAGALIDLENNR